MKIQELIQLEKIDTSKYMNQLEENYQKKKGYCWKIPSHSQEESVLLNNYEKDCIIAYVENKYLTIFLIKIGGKDNFKGFVCFKEFLNNILDTNYTIERIYNTGDILKEFDDDKENFKIVNNKEYHKFIKLKILEGIED